MSKRKRARDECSICKANGTNAIGHLAQRCSYKDGPFEGNFKGAIKAKKESEKRAKKVKGLGGVATVDVCALASDVRDLDKQIITQLQDQEAELKKPKQTRPRPNQIQWKQSDWRSSSYKNRYQVYGDYDY